MESKRETVFLTLQIDISMIAIHCPMIFILPSTAKFNFLFNKATYLPPALSPLSLSLAHVNSISNLYLFHKLLLYAYQLVISQNVTSSKSNNEIKKPANTNKQRTYTYRESAPARAQERNIYSHEFKLHAAKPSQATKRTPTI